MTNFILNRTILTKKIIDHMVYLLKDYFNRSRLYEHIHITDRWPNEAVRLPMIIIRSASATAQRVHFDDFIQDEYGYYQLVPNYCNNDLVGNNIQKVNLPDELNFDNRYPFDNSIGYPSGNDIALTIFTSGNSPFPTGIDTGIIMNVPPSRTFEPNSITYALDTSDTSELGRPSVTGTYNLAIGLNEVQDQFYLIYSGNTLSGNALVQPIEPNQWIINTSGLIPQLSGLQMKMADILTPGDQYLLNVFPRQRYTYSRYGGIYNISIQLETSALTTIESQEISDLAQRIINEKKFDIYREIGANLTSWAEGGGSEKDYINTPIFQNTINCELFVEWFDLRGENIVTSVSGTAIPTGSYNVNYVAPGVSTISQIYPANQAYSAFDLRQ